MVTLSIYYMSMFFKRAKNYNRLALGKAVKVKIRFK